MSHWTQITHFAHKNIFIIHLLGPKKELGLRESKSEHFAAAAGHKPSLLVSSSPPRSLPGIVERWYPFSCSDSLPSLPFILLLTILLDWPKHNHSSRPSLIYMFSEALLDKSSPHLFLSTSYYCVIGSHSSLSLSLSLSSLWLANQLPKDRNVLYICIPNDNHYKTLRGSTCFLA